MNVHGTMQDAHLVETEVVVPRPKRFIRETLVMPDGYKCDWYYVDTPPSVMVIPVTRDRRLVLVRQYRHNLKSYSLEFPAGTMTDGEQPDQAALRELGEETGYRPAVGTELRALGSFFSLPSETNKYTMVYLADPVEQAGPARLDNEIEKYFDMSVLLLPVGDVLDGIGRSITSMETVGALMAAGSALR